MMWPVMPICEAQLRDVKESDILEGGLYRKCDTYRGGGGYDQFPAIYNRRHHTNLELNNQFVVQLRGCPLRCPYCYVTRAGVEEGKCICVSTDDLITAYINSGCSVFHLMGGAPALYLDHWPEILRGFQGRGIHTVFHSDLLLVEHLYSHDTLEILSVFPDTLYAVSVKGSTAEEFFRNTGQEWNENLFWENLSRLIEHRILFYFTFTNMRAASIERFSDQIQRRFGSKSVLKDSFAIEIVHYKALN